MNTRSVFFLTCLLLAIAYPAAGADWKSAPASPVVHAPSAPIDQQTERLLESLRSARRSGDDQAARRLERQLGWRSEAPQSSEQSLVPAARIIRPELQRAPRRWDTDILVSDPTLDVDFPAMDTRDDGTLYIVCQDVELRNALDVYSSTDDGSNWNYWFSLYGGTQDLGHASVAVVDTGTPQLLIAYEKAAGTINSAIWVHGAFLDIALGHNSLVDSYPGYMVFPRICVDYPEYTNWYAYIVYATSIPGENDYWQIRFRRSLDYAETWTSPEVLATIYNTGDFGPWPDIDYGGSDLYVVYDVSDPGTGKRNVLERTSHSLGSVWDPAVTLAGTDGDEFYPRVCASNGPPVAVVGYAREYTSPTTQNDIETYVSTDAGGTWSWGYLPYTEYDEWAVDVCADRSFGRIHAAYGRIGDLIYTSSDYTAPNSWTAEEDLNTGNYASHSSSPVIAVDPAGGGGVRIAWSDFRDWEHYLIYFDSINPGPTAVPTGSDRNTLVPELSGLPDPMVDRATVRFTLARTGVVRLSIVDIQGRKLRTLRDGITSEGTHSLAWDGRDRNGRAIPAGVYFYDLTTEQGNGRRKFSIVR